MNAAGIGLDWLRVMANRARWKCVKRDRPRAWRIGIDFIVQTGEKAFHPEAMGYEVAEPDDANAATRKAETVARMNMTRAGLYAAINDWETSRTVNGAQYIDLLPPQRMLRKVAEADAEARTARARVVQAAERQYARDMVVVQLPTGHDDPPGTQRFALRHKPTGVSQFFTFPPGATDDDKRRIASETFDRLGEAVGRKMDELRLLRGALPRRVH